ncbi:hypothetical protein EYF80_015145 [Liparis tanakae]|uniref:Uncharacterized protein n=1 Tax=Liparis tanakae TaxID=230148 RepID=A0A4Z2I9F1_9TELE|nr:hypothetical protein EYF80_015145 [Liparis tanakae]
MEDREKPLQPLSVPADRLKLCFRSVGSTCGGGTFSPNGRYRGLQRGIKVVCYGGGKGGGATAKCQTQGFKTSVLKSTDDLMGTGFRPAPKCLVIPAPFHIHIV